MPDRTSPAPPGTNTRDERLELLGRFAARVGHELRNPLGVIANAVWYLDAVLTDVPAEVRDYLGILRRQVGATEKVLGDLLDVTRSRTPQPAGIPLAAVVEEQLARRKSLKAAVVRDFPDDLPPVWADPAQVARIVHHLLANAADALPADGSGTLTLRGRAGDGVVRLEVSDDGEGVPPELRERIFEPLFTTRPNGLGLGLSVSRRLASENGGSLRLAEPRPGRTGASFVLVLPAVQ